VRVLGAKRRRGFENVVGVWGTRGKNEWWKFENFGETYSLGEEGRAEQVPWLVGLSEVRQVPWPCSVKCCVCAQHTEMVLGSGSHQAWLPTKPGSPPPGLALAVKGPAGS
jgi:hypothetical protein